MPSIEKLVVMLFSLFLVACILTRVGGDADLIGIIYGLQYAPWQTLPPPRWARNSAICVTVPEEKEMASYKRLNTLLIKTKAQMERGNFSVIPLNKGNFYSPADQTMRWGSTWNATHYVHGQFPGWWRNPNETNFVPCERTLKAEGGGVLFWHNHYSDHYDHFLIDHLLVTTWLMEVLPPGTKVAIPYEKYPQAYMNWFPNLRSKVLWYKRGEVTCVDSGTILAVDPPQKILYESTTWLTTTLNARFHEEVLSLHGKPEALAGTKKKVILCSRDDNKNGRRLGNEDALIDTVKKMMVAYNREEEFYVHHGGGKSLQEQFDIFYTASMMVGGDGSAMASMMWTPWSGLHSSPTDEPVHVIEGICGARSKIRSNCPYFRTHLLEYGLAPWISYHHVIFNSSSTSKVTWIDMGDVEEILHAVWGKAPPPSTPNTYCLPFEPGQTRRR